MRQIMQNILTTLLLIAGMTVGVATLPTATSAACTGIACVKDGANGNKTGSAGTDTVPKVISRVTNMLLFLIGGVSVVMIVLAGLRYTTANGDQKQIESAKQTLLYAVIGVAVAIMAYAIVNFVITGLS